MEVSIRAAGAYQLRGNLEGIPKLLIIARETMKVIYRNLAFAILYNLIGIYAALTGQVNPLFAAILMPFSAVTVFLSTLAGTRRLRKVEP